MCQESKSFYFGLALSEEQRYQDHLMSHMDNHKELADVKVSYQEQLESKIKEPLERQQQWFPQGYQLLMFTLQPGLTMGDIFGAAAMPQNWPAEPPWKSGDRKVLFQQSSQ